jgi:hypothetical protein
MTIQWVTGFLDFPASVFEAGRHFWLGVTGYTLSPPRGPRADFATLVPGEGDAYLRVQRTYDGPVIRAARRSAPIRTWPAQAPARRWPGTRAC